MTNHRIRVLVAGEVYANRALVRPFLEDDGYEVVGEAPERTDVMPQLIRGQPDAVVLDEAILAGRRGGKMLQRIRRAAPEAKLVVITATPGAAAFADVHATLRAGLSLAALTALLGRLFAQDDASAPARAHAGAGAAVGAAGMTAAADMTTTSRAEPRGSAARFVASVGLPLVIAWSLIALLTTGGRALLHRTETTDVAAGGVVAVPLTDGPLQGAQDSLDRMVHAIKAGNPILASVDAQALMDARASARSLGYPIDGLDSDVESSLSAVVGLLSPGAVGALTGILDGLFPEVEADSGTPGGGSGLILGSAASTTGGTASVLPGAFGGGGNGGSGGGQGVGDGDGGGVGHEGVGGGNGEGDAELGPGDGRAWGQSHNHADEDGEGFGNGSDVEVHGHSDEAPGHDPEHHGHAHAWGHQKHWGHGDGERD